MLTNSPLNQKASIANWMLLAAACIAWTGILIEFYFRFDLETAQSVSLWSLGPWGLVLLGVLSGIANIGWYARCDKLARQWLLIGTQIITCLVALYLTRLNTPAMMLIVAMAQIPARAGVVVISAAFIATNLALGIVLLAINSTAAQAAVEWFLFLGFQLFALTVAVVQQRERFAREALATINAELIATRRLLADSARAEERLRVSRELHDIAGHTLTAMSVSLEAQSRKVPDELKAGILAIRNLSRELLDDIRAVVSHLRQHDFSSLQEALGKLRERFPDVCIHLHIDAEVEADQVATVVRCVQEAITNAVRHGNAKNIWIRTKRIESETNLTVRDDGTGGLDYQVGNGLRGMGERLDGLGGRLDVRPSSNDGWSLAMYFLSHSAAYRQATQ